MDLGAVCKGNRISQQKHKLSDLGIWRPCRRNFHAEVYVGQVELHHLNPVRAEIVEKAIHYVYSSASYYTKDKGLLNIELADNPIINTSDTKEFWKYNNYDE